MSVSETEWERERDVSLSTSVCAGSCACVWVHVSCIFLYWISVHYAQSSGIGYWLLYRGPVAAPLFALPSLPSPAWFFLCINEIHAR